LAPGTKLCGIGVPRSLRALSRISV
jgi:hypothetical protein